MSNLGFHTDNNFEYGDQFGRIAGTVKENTKHLAAITCIMNPNDLSKAGGAINAAVNQALRFHNVETNMSGTDTGEHTAQNNVNMVLAAIKPALALYPNARWAYFRNEIGDWSRAEFYALEMKLWIEGLAKLGYYGGICGWSFGTPSYELWPKFDTALAAANANGGAVLLHEYGVLTMKSAYDAAKGRGHHCLRYRNVWAQNNYPTRYPKLMWWVTETGLDKDVNAGIGGGWKDIHAPADQYLSDLDWYDSEISKDGVSATVYQWGTEAKWAPYDIQGPVADNLLAHIGAGVPRLKAGGTTQTPPGPIEIPIPPPPETVVIFENHFDRFEPRLFADGIGDIMIPPGFEIGYLTGKNYGQIHGELSPSRETGVLKPDTFIFHVMGRMNAWLRVVFPTTPGDVIRLTVETSAAVDKVNRSIGLATDARESPTELERVTISDPTHQVITQTITATGKSMSAFWQAFTDQTIRSDARIHSMKIERVGVGVPLPPPPDPAFPAWYRVATGDTARLRKRLAPVDGEIIELQVNGSELLLESITNGWGKEKGAGLYASAQYLIRIRGA